VRARRAPPGEGARPALRGCGGGLAAAARGADPGARAAPQNASEFQTWKSRPQLIHMQYAMLNEATGNMDTPRLAKWQSILVRRRARRAMNCAARALRPRPLLLLRGG